MKRMLGWGLVLAGGAAVLWGAHSLLTGARSEFQLSPDLTINGLSGGLVGLAVLTVGLVWVRD
jgi:hypothetical protein